MTTPTRKPVTVPMLQLMKSAGEKIVMVTAYDSTFARIIDDAGVDAILVGDSVATVLQGHHNTIPVTLSEMAYHTALVRRAQPKALVVGDLPFGSYQVSAGQGIESSVVLMKAGAQCVKLEGGTTVATTIEAITRADIPVMGHIGLTPQSVHRMGGRQRLLEDAHAVEQAGAFAIVLEGIPTELAQEITSKISIPTIGIGAGSFCDGQVLVMHDILGLSERELTFTKKYVDMRSLATNAFQEFAQDVRNGSWPDDKHSFH